MHDVTPPGFQPPQQVQVPIGERVMIMNSHSEVVRGVDGTRILVVTTFGRQYQIPYSPDVARDIGMQLAAPGIVPPSGNGAPPEQG